LSFTIFHACLVGSIAFVIYITHIIYRQSIRLIELEKTNVIARKSLRKREKAHRKEVRIVKQKLELGASLLEEAEYCAQQARSQLSAVQKRVDELEIDKVRNEDARVASERRMQKQLDGIMGVIIENERASKKDYEEWKLAAK